jgi:predicted flavoprotein YhiN
MAKSLFTSAMKKQTEHAKTKVDITDPKVQSFLNGSDVSTLNTKKATEPTPAAVVVESPEEPVKKSPGRPKKTTTTQKHRVIVDVPEEIYAQMKLLATKLGISGSAYVIQAIAQRIQSDKNTFI